MHYCFCFVLRREGRMKICSPFLIKRWLAFAPGICKPKRQRNDQGWNNKHDKENWQTQQTTKTKQKTKQDKKQNKTKHTHHTHTPHTQNQTEWFRLAWQKRGTKLIIFYGTTYISKVSRWHALWRFLHNFWHSFSFVWKKSCFVSAASKTSVTSNTPNFKINCNLFKVELKELENELKTDIGP